MLTHLKLTDEIRARIALVHSAAAECGYPLVELTKVELADAILAAVAHQDTRHRARLARLPTRTRGVVPVPVSIRPKARRRA